MEISEAYITSQDVAKIEKHLGSIARSLFKLANPMMQADVYHHKDFSGEEPELISKGGNDAG